MKKLHLHLRLRLKEYILRRINIGFSRHFVLAGLESGFVPFQKPQKPLNLIDVGSCSGQFAKAIEAYCGVKKGLLIEPQPHRFKELENDFLPPKYILKNCAIADKNHVMNMDILNHDFSSSLLPVLPDVGGVGKRLNLKVKETIKVNVRTLDNLLSEIKWIDQIDLLKIDVQGAELKVLRGALNALRRTQMVLTEISFCPQYKGSSVFSEVYDFMVPLGFILTGLQPGFRGECDELLQADAVFKRKPRK